MSGSSEVQARFSSLVPIRPSGSAPPIFLIHGVDGEVPAAGKLLEHLDSRHPIYGIQAQALDPVGPALTTLEEMAAYYLAEIRETFPQGPYCFLGFSFGGMVAFEMARQLRAQGKESAFIGMIDSTEMSYLRRQARLNSPTQRASDLYQRLKRRFGEAFERPDTLAYIKEKIESRSLRMLCALTSKFGLALPPSLHYPYHVNWFAAINYMPAPYDGKIFLFKAVGHFWEPGMPADLGWGSLVTQGVEMFEIPGDHVSMFIEPNVSSLGKQMAECLAREARLGDLQDTASKYSTSGIPDHGGE